MQVAMPQQAAIREDEAGPSDEVHLQGEAGRPAGIHLAEHSAKDQKQKGSDPALQQLQHSIHDSTDPHSLEPSAEQAAGQESSSVQLEAEATRSSRDPTQTALKLQSTTRIIRRERQS